MRRFFTSCIVLTAISQLVMVASVTGQIVIPIDDFATGGTGGNLGDPFEIATLTITQNGLDVDFDLMFNTGTGLDASSKLTGFGFTATIVPSAPDFTNFGGTQTTYTGPLIPPGGGVVPSYTPNGFALGFTFPNSGDTFAPGENFTWRILNSTEANFTLPLVLGSGSPAAAGVHVQGLNVPNRPSTTYTGVPRLPNGQGPVPEPTSVAVWSALVAFALGYRVVKRTR